VTGSYRVGVIRGDGTGPEVVGEGLKVLEAVRGDASFDLVEFDLGADRYLRTGDTLPDDVVLEVWQRFRDALMPLHSAGKLGAVLFQFPQWFVISKKNKAYIEECAERLPDFRVAVEFRHKSWMEERNVEETLGFLSERDLPYVCVDMPQGFDSSLPPIAAATADDLAMVRFHGRDPKAWESKAETASERFRYDYSKGELGEWVPKLEELSGQVRETHVLMNNCYANYGSTNARELAALLADLSTGD